MCEGIMNPDNPNYACDCHRFEAAEKDFEEYDDRESEHDTMYEHDEAYEYEAWEV